MSLISDILLMTDKENQLNKYKKLQKEVILLDSKLDTDYQDQKKLILENSIDIQAIIENVVLKNKYAYCIRGAFGAVIIDLDSRKKISKTAFNSPPSNMLDMCMLNDEQCIRSISNPVHGSGYDLCPARHARERIYVDDNYKNSDNLVWVEGGAIKDENNNMKFWDIYNNHKLHIYPCLRCLSTSLLQNVKILAELIYTDKWEVFFHDITKHAELLLVYNFINKERI